jgi:hypothetical protein
MCEAFVKRPPEEADHPAVAPRIRARLLNVCLPASLSFTT